MNTVRDVDKGWGALEIRLRGLKNAYLAVGILEKDAGKPYFPPLRKTVSEGKNGPIRRVPSIFMGRKTLGEVAWGLEFGGPNAPPRYPISGWWDLNAAKLSAEIAKGVQNVIKGRVSMNFVLGAIGRRAVTGIKARILASGLIPNAKSTILRKGSDVPGVDTTQYVNALSYSIEVGK